MAHRELVTFQNLKYFLRTLSLQCVHKNEGFPYLEILFPFAPMLSSLKGLAITEDKKTLHWAVIHVQIVLILFILPGNLTTGIVMLLLFLFVWCVF